MNIDKELENRFNRYLDLGDDYKYIMRETAGIVKNSGACYSMKELKDWKKNTISRKLELDKQFNDLLGSTLSLLIDSEVDLV